MLVTFVGSFKLPFLCVSLRYCLLTSYFMGTKHTSQLLDSVSAGESCKQGLPFTDVVSKIVSVTSQANTPGPQ